MPETIPRYRNFGAYLRSRFGEKVYRVGLVGGFTCPNRDGTRGLGGCVFCNPASSEPLGHREGMPLAEQLERGVGYVRWRHGARKALAYFQDHTGTHAGAEELEALYREALAHPAVAGLVVSTRPDCLPPDVLDLLARLARESFLWVELGVQSAHDRSLARMNRCHTVKETREAVEALHERGIPLAAHVILGLPGETAEDMLETARFLGALGVEAVKIHNLHVVRGTRLAALHVDGDYRPLDLAEYVDLAVRFLEHLPARMLIQRLTGEAPRRLTVAPDWSVNKLAVLNAIERELAARDTWQGRALGAAREELRVPCVPRCPTDGAA